jgi:hypothetical protein
MRFFIYFISNRLEVKTIQRQKDKIWMETKSKFSIYIPNRPIGKPYDIKFNLCIYMCNGWKHNYLLILLSFQHLSILAFSLKIKIVASGLASSTDRWREGLISSDGLHPPTR